MACDRDGNQTPATNHSTGDSVDHVNLGTVPGAG
jgi:hypothetical protein